MNLFCLNIFDTNVELAIQHNYLLYYLFNRWQILFAPCATYSESCILFAFLIEKLGPGRLFNQAMAQ